MTIERVLSVVAAALGTTFVYRTFCGGATSARDHPTNWRREQRWVRHPMLRHDRAVETIKMWRLDPG